MWTADLIHKNEQFYNEPEKFNPHRFDGQESNTLQEKVCKIPKNFFKMINYGLKLNPHTGHNPSHAVEYKK